MGSGIAAKAPMVRYRARRDIPKVEFFYLLVGGLATYRLSLLISKEDGPAYIFRKLRRKAPPESSLKQGLSCEWCVSVWMSALVATFYWWRGLIPGLDWPLYWLAMSAIGVICNQQWSRSRTPDLERARAPERAGPE